MRAKYPLYITSFAGIMLIGPNSEAIFNNTNYFNNSNNGYHCQSGYQQKKITIYQQEDDIHTLTCRVSWQENGGEEKVLWNAQRNIMSCEKSASAIVMRLEDRGWQCKSLGM